LFFKCAVFLYLFEGFKKYCVSFSLIMEINGGDKIHQLLHHLHEYHLATRKRIQLLFYILLVVMYFGVSAALLGANCLDQAVIEEYYTLPFHLAEFWSQFLFSILEAFILVAADIIDVDTPAKFFQLLLVIINVILTLVAALLYTFSPLLFERPAHYIEYSAQITLTMANFVFIFKLGDSTSLIWKRFRVAEIVVVSLLLVMAIFKLLLFIPVIPIDMGPERSSHFLEFIGEMGNALFAFVFAILLFLNLKRVESQHDHDLHSVVL
jgi:hypothetical protein